MPDGFGLNDPDPLYEAKVWLVMRHPFFAQAVLEQRFVPDRETVSTLTTDGREVFYNPEFVSDLSTEELAGAICHELMHNLLFHLSRRTRRIAELWNLATDIAVNNDLIEAGLKLPPGSISHPAFQGLAAEEIYSRLMQECWEHPEAADTGDDEGQAAALEHVLARYGSAGKELCRAHARWETAAGDALEGPWANRLFKGMASAGGGAPGGCVRMARVLAPPGFSWQDSLAEMLACHLKPADFDPARPNRKYLSHGLYLPALESEASPTVIVALDSSASISRNYLGVFAGELLALLDEVEEVEVLAFDTQVYLEDPCGGRAVKRDPSCLALPGGGGTDFRSVFNHITRTGRPPDLLVVFTDLDGRFPESAPTYPVIWITPTDAFVSPPFGEVLAIPPQGGVS